MTTCCAKSLSVAAQECRDRGRSGDGSRDRSACRHQSHDQVGGHPDIEPPVLALECISGRDRPAQRQGDRLRHPVRASTQTSGSILGAFTTNGGVIYFRVPFTNTKTLHGKPTGGSGKFAGVHGTIAATSLNNAGPRPRSRSSTTTDACDSRRRSGVGVPDIGANWETSRNCRRARRSSPPGGLRQRRHDRAVLQPTRREKRKYRRSGAMPWRRRESISATPPSRGGPRQATHRFRGVLRGGFDFAVTKRGADWDEQATKKAHTYLEQMAFSRRAWLRG